MCMIHITNSIQNTLSFAQASVMVYLLLFFGPDKLFVGEHTISVKTDLLYIRY